MIERPKMKIIPDCTDKLLSLASTVLLIAVVIFAVWLYLVSPEIVANHFDLSGKPDSYGSKNYLLILPAIALFVFVLLNSLVKYPHRFNYPQNINSENAEAMYKRGIRMLRLLNVGIMAFLFLMQFQMRKGIRDEALPMLWWELPLLLLITVGMPIAVSLGMLSSKKK